MTATFYVGDALEVMAKLPEKSVDLVLSSPPFLALRSYLPADHPDKAKEGGSQPTPGEYIDWLVDVAEACDRVLAPHGSLCFELGDTYAGSGGAGGDYDLEGLREGQPKFRQIFSGGWPLPKSLSLIPELFRLTLVYGTNPLTGRQTERWRLRNVIRWVRPNPPVGALGDKFRPATSELMVFCKSAKRYFDLDSVRTPFVAGENGGGSGHTDDGTGESGGTRRMPERKMTHAGAPPLDWWQISEGNAGGRVRYLIEESCEHGYFGKHITDHDPAGDTYCLTEPVVLPNRPDYQAGAPPLDWWNIPPGGYEGAHYAVFPPELCVRPIKAMSPETVCRTCGEPRRRIVGEAEYINRNGQPAALKFREGIRPAENVNQWLDHGRDNTAIRTVETLGFSDCGHGSMVCRRCNVPSDYSRQADEESGFVPPQVQAAMEGLVCPCGSTDFEYVEDQYRPGLVLDPFVGSGTVLAVATGHGREAIGIDLDERNFDLALERVGPLMLEKGEL